MTASPNFWISTCAGMTAAENSVGFARENKLIHPVAGFQTASKPKGKT